MSSRDLFAGTEVVNFPDGPREVVDPYQRLRDPSDPATQSWLTDQADEARKTLPTETIDVVADFYTAEITKSYKTVNVATPATNPDPGDTSYYFYRAPAPDTCVLYKDDVPVYSPETSIPVFDPTRFADQGILPYSLSSLPSTKDGITIIQQPIGTSDLIQPYYYSSDDDAIRPDQLRPVHIGGTPVRSPDQSGFFYGGFDRDTTRAALSGDEIQQPFGAYFHPDGATEDHDDIPLVVEPGEEQAIKVAHGTNGLEVMIQHFDVRTGTNAWSIVSANPAEYGTDLEPLTHHTAGRTSILALHEKEAIGFTQGQDGLELLSIPRNDGASPESWDTLFRFNPNETFFSDRIAYKEGVLCIPIREGLVDKVSFMSEQGDHIGDYRLPPGTMVWNVAHGHNSEFFAEVMSNDNRQLLHFSSPDSEPTVLQQTNRGLPFADIELQYVTARDGEQLPILVYSPPEADKNTPTIMSVYGGHELQPSIITDPCWLEAGGRAVLTCLRGDMNGLDWADAGKGPGKQTTVDDAVDIARYLTTEVVDPSKLGISGGSNGGLVATNAVLQAPDAFGAALISHPIADMAHYVTGSGSEAWIYEYGDPSSPDDIDHLRSLTPALHEGSADLPPTLVITSEQDHRVPAWHAYGLAAALQDIQTNDQNPVTLAHLNEGHAKHTTDENQAAYALQTSFLATNLGLDTTYFEQPNQPDAV